MEGRGPVTVPLVCPGRWSYELLLWARDCALVWVLGHCGLRVGEVCRLGWRGCFGPEGSVASVTVGEGVAEKGAIRVLPVESRTREALERMRAAVWWYRGPSEPAGLFGCGRGWRQLGSRRVRQIVGRVGVRAIGRVVRPHELRHTFGSRLRVRCDLPCVQSLLGHKDLGSTQRYLRVTWEEKVDAVAKLRGV